MRRALTRHLYTCFERVLREECPEYEISRLKVEGPMTLMLKPQCECALCFFVSPSPRRYSDEFTIDIVWSADGELPLGMACIMSPFVEETRRFELPSDGRFAGRIGGFTVTEKECVWTISPAPADVVDWDKVLESDVDNAWEQLKAVEEPISVCKERVEPLVREAIQFSLVYLRPYFEFVKEAHCK